MPHHLQARIRLRFGGQPSQDPSQRHACVRGEWPQRARQRASLVSAQGLAALQRFLPLGDNVAKAEGLPSGEGEEWRERLALPCM